MLSRWALHHSAVPGLRSDGLRSDGLAGCNLGGMKSNSRRGEGFLPAGPKTMTSLMNKSTIPLDHAVLCLDCNSVSDANRECPACGSRALMNLSVVLNRPAEVAQYERLANAA